MTTFSTMARRPGAAMILLVLVLAAMALTPAQPAAAQVNVLLRVVDQHGIDIPGSVIYVGSVGYATVE